MEAEGQQAALAELNQQVQDIWDQNASFWDAQMGDGNLFHLQLVAPAVEHLLQPWQGMRVLEIACGNGQFSRQLAAQGCLVTATDFSAVFLQRAGERAGDLADRLEYRLVDATNEAQLLALGTGRFDAMVCNMALMDMTVIDPLMRAVPQLLKPGGRFVFSIMHPCFNSVPTTSLLVEEEDRDGELVTTYAVKVSRYRPLSHVRGLGMIGQPAPHYYFHRSLTDLLAPAFAAGLVLDGLEEPVFSTEISSPRPLSWLNFKDIPPVLAVRLRPR